MRELVVEMIERKLHYDIFKVLGYILRMEGNYALKKETMK